MFMKKRTLLLGTFILLLAALALTAQSASAAPLDDFPITVTQPDGTVLHLFVSGDEYYNWIHDANGYTIVKDPVSGYYVYAYMSRDRLVPSSYVVGTLDPARVGLQPNQNIPPQQVEEIRQAFVRQTREAAGTIENAPTTGTINNLVVFIRFSDESEFTDLTSWYTGMLTDSTPGANSLRNYYQEVSYGALTVNSTLLPTPGATVVSYQDSHPRGYYQPYDATTNPIGYTGGDNGLERTQREHTLLRDAVNSIPPAQWPSATAIDGDSDGIVDSLTFIVSGSPTGWSSLLWPHQWNLFTYTVTINGKTVDAYSFHLNSSLGTGVLAHEMFHALGAPDLYHYSYDGLQPVGGWDVMEYDADPPQHMGCYMKYMYGNWIPSIPELTTPGTYTLNSLISSTNNCKKIASPYSATEYFVVEYRDPTDSTFESSLPGKGLLVYRVDPTLWGNADGPPDEVYLYRPGGTISTNGNVNAANFSSQVSRTAINDATDPSSFLSDGSPGGLNLCNIGASGDTISFEICTGSVYSISGNAGTGNATLSYTGDTSGSVTSDLSGAYLITVSSGWSGTVTPSKTGYTFDPPSRTYTDVNANQTAQDYTATGPVNVLQDPSFEAFLPDYDSPYWGEYSLNFFTPLCDPTSCGLDVAQTGWVWGWFGGAGVGSNEEGDISQTVTIPNGSATLEFYLWLDYAGVGSDVNDEFTAQIDGVEVFSANATQTAQYPSYTLVSVDVSDYADGASHVVKFAVSTTGQTVNFYLDDVALLSMPGGEDDYTISGNAGTGNATLSYTGGTPVTADGSGNYSITVPSGWSGTVTPSKTGYTFTPASRNYDNVTANQTAQNYTATLNTYTLSVSKSGTGSGTVTSSPVGIDCGADCTQAYDYNTSVTLTATAATGSTFTGWSGTCTGTGACVVSMTAARAVTATFTLNTYTLTVSKSGTGSGTVTSSPVGIDCGSDCTQSYDYNTSVTLTATAATGSTFTGWSGACTGTGACVVSMTAARAVTAAFTLNTYTLTVSKEGTGAGTVTSSPVGIDCGSDCTQAYDYNTSVTLTATPAAGSTFTGWSGACTGTSTCVVSMTTARAVTATFTLNTYTLTVSKSGTGSGTVTSSPVGIDCGSDCTQDYGYNTSVTLTATAATGSTFTGWSGACTGTGSCVVSMTAARSVTATFTLNTYALTVSKAGTGSGTVTSSPVGIDCGSDCTETYDYNTLVTLTATADAGSAFTGWSGHADCSDGSVTMNAVKSCIATFTPPSISVSIGGTVQETYDITPGQSQRVSYPKDDGPVKIASSDGSLLIASERINLLDHPAVASYTEFIGMPATKLTDTYIFPWYNNVSLDSQLRVANVGTASTTVRIKIGTQVDQTYPLLPNNGLRLTFPVDTGPVEVTSSGGVPIIASERINLLNHPAVESYTEFIGLLGSNTAGTRYLFPWYNNVSLDSQLRFANVGTGPTTVTVKIGTQVDQTYSLAINESKRISYPGVDAGPVEVTSSGGVPIIASERINLLNHPAVSSYSEFLGLPGTTLTHTKYLFPWYNNLSLDSQLRVANVGTAATTVRIRIGTQVDETYPLAANQGLRLTFPVDTGPVTIESSGGVPIIASERINLLHHPTVASYAEFLGLSVGAPLGWPGNQLSDTFWFPWYNNVSLDSQLRFGVP